MKSKEDNLRETCPIVGSIQVIGSMWRLIVIRYLMDRPMSFNELLRAANGLNSKTLSRTLKYLQQEGIVKREIVSTQPFSVRYSLTEKGYDLQPVIEALKTWGIKWLAFDKNDKNKNKRELII